MTQSRICSECGAALPADAPGGLCPRCLWDVGAGGRATTATLDLAATEPNALHEAASAIPAVRRFGNYELLEEIARGGMGVVLKARQHNLNRLVAIKMIRGERLAQADEVQRFRREAAAAATLQHPHLVAIHEAGEVEGQHFYSMDFVDGRSLAEIVRDHPLSPRRAATYVKVIAQAIQYAHERGILHRDLKPSNVLIDQNDQPRVTDFGLAKLLTPTSAAGLSASDLTVTGQVLGSPSYMAPEQAAGHARELDVRTDVYALGAILYESVSGRPPFQAETSLETLKLVVESDPVSPRRLNPRLPRDLETICLKCLEKEPRRRYASAQALGDELGRFLENKPIIARPVCAPERLWRWCQRKPLVAGLAAGLLVAWLWNLSTTPLTPLLGGLAVGFVLAGWFGWRALLSSRQLEREKMERAIDTALAAAWAGDREGAQEAIKEAERHGVPKEWVWMLNGQIALHTLRIKEAFAAFEQAIVLAPGSVAARAMLATACLYSGQADRYAEMIGLLGGLSPQTPEDYLFLGAALVAGYADTSKAVSLLEYAKQKRPSGVTFLQLSLAEAFHAADAASWPTVRRAIDHGEWASELLGPKYPMVLTARLNAYNFAIRLCPEPERPGMLERAGEAARALESTADPIGHMQRAFYFELIGEEDAVLNEFRSAVQGARTGLFAAWYAAAMFGRNRSAQALAAVSQLEPDALTAVSRAYLLIDQNQPEEAERVYRQVATTLGHATLLAEAALLLAGERERVAADCARLLQATPAQHPDYQAFRYLASQCSPEDFIGDAGASRVGQCKAHFVIALSRLAQADREAARRHFRQSVEAGTHWLPVFQWSRAFLARMEQDPNWPPWIQGKTSL